ncbi:polyketide synthase dehydratase domain-containing protein, partial [Kitasatospora aureofaciens]|uniref:polyketide synthase dehydratase domain-containing protein n=1 Tax=Kitasatospora aureofaciens TaxID=1894 RepID=UPI00190163BF
MASAEELCSPEYWVRHVREAVRFADGMAALGAEGITRFVELGPDGVLSAMGADCVEDAVFVPTLRKDRHEPEAAVAALAQAHAYGVPVDWAAYFAGTGARRVDLPTYAFQHQRYWPKKARFTPGDVTGLGLGAADHPLLGACVSLAGEDGLVMTGRIGPDTHPWLAEHAVHGRVWLPGTAFVELAVQAGDRTGCALVDELTLHQPLVLPEHGGVFLQLLVSEPDATGRRPLRVHSRPADAQDADDAPWTLHASGSLAAADPAVPAATFDLEAWPPAGAAEVPVDGLYERLTEAGFGYGPLFRGLRAAWQRDGELYAEVELPADDRTADGFGLHPALLDAGLHGLGLGVLEALDEGSETGTAAWVPFSWSGVTLHASGARALRVRVAPAGRSAVSVHLADLDGQPVASVDALVLRRATAADGPDTAAAGADAAYLLDWVRTVPGAGPQDDPADWALLGDQPDVAALLPGVPVHQDLAALADAAPRVVLTSFTARPGEDLIAAAHRLVRDAARLLQGWLADDRLADARLVVLTRGALAADATERAEPAAAAVHGLLRSAQSENPGRFLLLDLPADPAAPLRPAVAAALGADEPHLMWRDGTLRAPRLVPPASVGSLLALPADGSAWRMDADGRGAVDGLSVRPSPEALRVLGVGEVRVGVRAAGVNFRDVLIALG